MTGNVLITGCTGFIGSHVAEYFMSMNLPVKCLVRTESDLTFLNKLGCRTVYGDILDEESVINAMEGCSSVIHIAGLSRDWGKKEDFFRTNVDATMNILRCAKKKNLKKIIITGSVSSYGEENNYLKKTEDSELKSHYNYFLDSVSPCKMNFYRDSKARMTEKAIEYARSENLNLIIIEPTFVFGEREFNTGFYEYLKTVKQGTPFLPGSLINKFHVIYAGDLARCFFLAWKSEITSIEKFIAGNTEAPMQNEFYRMLCEAADMKKPNNIRKNLIYPIALFMELFSNFIGTKNPPLLTRGRVNMFYDNVEYNTSKAKKILGFENVIKLQTTVQKTVDWYKENQLL